jgi:adenylyltransferase/sulfurtransferase
MSQRHIVITITLDGQPSLLLFSSLITPPFRSVKLRNKRSDCVACSGQSPLNTTDYIQFCGGPPVNWVQNGKTSGVIGHRISPEVIKQVYYASG